MSLLVWPTESNRAEWTFRWMLTDWGHTQTNLEFMHLCELVSSFRSFMVLTDKGQNSSRPFCLPPFLYDRILFAGEMTENCVRWYFALIYVLLLAAVWVVWHSVSVPCANNWMQLLRHLSWISWISSELLKLRSGVNATCVTDQWSDNQEVNWILLFPCIM